MDEQSSLLVVMIVTPFWQEVLAKFVSSHIVNVSSRPRLGKGSNSSRINIAQDSLLSIGCRIVLLLLLKRLVSTFRPFSKRLFPYRPVSSTSRLVGGSLFCHGLIPRKDCRRPNLISSWNCSLVPCLGTPLSLRSIRLLSGRKDSSSNVPAPSADVRTSLSRHLGNLANCGKEKNGWSERKDKRRILRIFEVDKTSRLVNERVPSRLDYIMANDIEVI